LQRSIVRGAHMQADRQDDERPRWHAPPRPAAPPAMPPIAPPPPDPPPRSGGGGATAALRALLLLLVVVLAWTVLRPAVAPAPAPTATATLVTYPRSVPRPEDTVACFHSLTLAPTPAAPAIGREAAEATVREGYDLPFRAKRPGTLADARVVVLGYSWTSFGAPVYQATLEAETRGRVAWLLSFGLTPALEEPASSTARALYALVDATAGGTIDACEAMSGATTASGPLPAISPEDMQRQPIDAALAAVPFPARAAGWLPFAPSASFAQVNRLPRRGGGRLLRDGGGGGRRAGARHQHHQPAAAGDRRARRGAGGARRRARGPLRRSGHATSAHLGGRRRVVSDRGPRAARARPAVSRRRSPRDRRRTALTSAGWCNAARVGALADALRGLAALTGEPDLSVGAASERGLLDWRTIAV